MDKKNLCKAAPVYTFICFHDATERLNCKHYLRESAEYVWCGHQSVETEWSSCDCREARDEAIRDYEKEYGIKENAIALPLV